MMINFACNFRIFAFFFRPLTKPVNDHLKRVYATLFVGCLLAATACYLGYFRMLPFIFKFHFLNAIATIGLVIGLAASDKGPQTEKKRFGKCV